METQDHGKSRMDPQLLCRDGQGMDKQQTILHMDMHAAAMKCMAVASTGLDRATRALDAVGSPGSRAALQLDLDALIQSLMRRPLSHFLAEVSRHRKHPCGPLTRLDSLMRYMHLVLVMGSVGSLRQKCQRAQMQSSKCRLLACADVDAGLVACLHHFHGRTT